MFMDPIKLAAGTPATSATFAGPRRAATPITAILMIGTSAFRATLLILVLALLSFMFICCSGAARLVALPTKHHHALSYIYAPYQARSGHSGYVCNVCQTS